LIHEYVAVDGPAWYELSPQERSASTAVADKEQQQQQQQARPEQQQQQQQADSSSFQAPPSSSTCSSSSSSSSSGRALSAELLSPRQVQQLQRYLAHMLEVNKSMNLTGDKQGCLYQVPAVATT
jgi:hypothetical protein